MGLQELPDAGIQSRVCSALLQRSRETRRNYETREGDNCENRYPHKASVWGDARTAQNRT
jgi:hypothetical protein